MTEDERTRLERELKSLREQRNEVIAMGLLSPGIIPSGEFSERSHRLEAEMAQVEAKLRALPE